MPSDLPRPLRLCIATAIAISFPCSSAFGQRREVFPRRYASATREGGGVVQPLHLSNAIPQQPLWEQVLFKVDARAAGSVTAIAFRRSTRSGGPPTTPPITVDLELGFGHSRRTVYQPSLYVKENRGDDFQIVVDRKFVNFPAVPQQTTGTGPYPFSYRIPFDRPGNLSAGKTGMRELRVYQSTMTFQQFRTVGVDGVTVPALFNDPRYARTQVGSQCTEFQVLSSVMAPGMAAEVFTNPLVFGFGRLSHTFVYAGVSQTQWSGLKLPFDLTPFGAPGCKINTSLDVLLPVLPEFTLATSVLAAVYLPDVPALVGSHFYLQAIALPVGRTKLGIVTSNRLKVRIGPRPDYEAVTVLIPAVDRYDLGYWTFGATPVFELTVQ